MDLGVMDLGFMDLGAMDFGPLNNFAIQAGLPIMLL